MKYPSTFNCPVEATLDLIGGKYKSLILFHLVDDVLRFSELQRLIPQSTPKMLTQQLGFRGGDRTDIELPAVQRELIAALHHAGKKVVLVGIPLVTKAFQANSILSPVASIGSTINNVFLDKSGVAMYSMCTSTVRHSLSL